MNRHSVRLYVERWLFSTRLLLLDEAAAAAYEGDMTMTELHSHI